jgi:hypothetical protein
LFSSSKELMIALGGNQVFPTPETNNGGFSLALISARTPAGSQPPAQSIEHPCPGIALIGRSADLPEVARRVNMKILQIDLNALGIRFMQTPPAGTRKVVTQTTLDRSVQNDQHSIRQSSPAAGQQPGCFRRTTILRPLSCRIRVTNPGSSELLADLSASIRKNPQLMNASFNHHRLPCYFHPMRFRNSFMCAV